MSWFGSKRLVLLLVLLVLFFTTCTCGVTGSQHLMARSHGGHHHPHRHHHGHRGGPSPKPTLPSPSSQKGTYNVLDFGAHGNGVIDDTKAFQAAWAAACNMKASKVVVPSKYTFLVGPISFAGPHCQPNIVFQLDGTIIAPTSPKSWGSGTGQWLQFTTLRGIMIRGSGIIDGQGSVWWTSNSHLVMDDEINSIELGGKMPSTRPTALTFYGSYNVTVTGITIRNSQKFHLTFDNCQAVQVFAIKVSSPADSPNTDGIHLHNSNNVAIHHCDLECGDDCVSIQTGCSNVIIHDVNCGPGHGISIGGLGKDDTNAVVSNVIVNNINFRETTSGLRIKTWQGGSGSVRNVRYSNIYVSEVQKPIVIDQFYCDMGGQSCRNQSAAVALSGVTYRNIRGTYTVQPVHLACSDSEPCSGIILTDIELRPLQLDQYHMYGPFCWEAYGELHGPTIPPIDCLRGGSKTRNSSNTLEI